MRRTAACLALAAALLLSVEAALAVPVVGVSANTLPSGAFMIDTWASWKSYTRSYIDDETGWGDLPSDYSITSATVSPRLYYGVTDWLTVRLTVPLEDRARDFPDNGGSDSNTGLGDIVVDPKIQVYKGETGYPRVALLTGIRFPTGETDGIDSEGTLALSDGSTDYVFGGVVTHKVENVTGHACVTYWLNGENEAGNDVSDIWIASLSIEDQILDDWTLLWEAKAYYGDEPSDYYRVYACPGVAWSNGGRFTIGLSGMVQLASEGGQLDYDWAPYLRAYYCFF